VTQLQQIYIILFVYVGMNTLRKIFFGKIPMIWNKTIPEPDKVQVILDAIEYARFEEDLIK